MKITLRQIPQEGLDWQLDTESKEVKNLLENALKGIAFDFSKISATLHLINVNDNVHADGQLQLSYTAPCARCGEEALQKITHPIRAIFIPENDMKSDDEGNSSAQDPDGLVLMSYKNETIHFENLLNDEIALAIPYNVYCSDKTACEKRAQEILRRGNQNQVGDIRFAVLANLKPKRDS